MKVEIEDETIFITSSGGKNSSQPILQERIFNYFLQLFGILFPASVKLMVQDLGPL